MNKRRWRLATLLALALPLAAGAAQPFHWPGKAKAAVSLAYDDALDSQLDHAIPALDKAGLKATFYLQLSNPAVDKRLAEWRAAAARGHELGNHTLFHQCSASLPGREFVQAHRNLDTTTVAQLKDQVVLANTMLYAIDGRRERTYTTPCGDLKAGGEDYLPAIAPLFVGVKAGGGSGVAASMAGLDPLAVPVLAPVGLSGTQLIDIVKAAVAQGTMANFTFHGVGGDYLVTSKAAHAELLAYLAAHRDVVWTDSFLNIMRHVRSQQAAGAPRADHHQHVMSPAIADLLGTPAAQRQPLGAAEVIALLDKAGIDRAVLLSVAYMYGNPNKPAVDNELAKVRAENDWNAAQAALFPKRLTAFCGVNPLRDYALDELARCAASAGLRRGVKLHFGNSDVQLENPDHLAKMRTFFAAANAHGMAIAVHMRASISKQRPYGREQARLFLEQLLPMAPDVPVQVAHLSGTGPGFDDPPAQEALAVLAEAFEQHDARVRNLWVDIASNVDRDIAPATAALIARRIGQIGASHLLYGTDAALGSNLRPAESWVAFHKLPLSPAQFAQIAENVAPYLK